MLSTFAWSLASLVFVFSTHRFVKGFNVMEIIVGLIIIALIGYLFVSVIKPEWF